MTILEEINPSRLTQAFSQTVQCLLCPYGSLVSAPRQMHLLKHIVNNHWCWWISLEWEDEFPPARYRHWKCSKFYSGGLRDNVGLLQSDSEESLVDLWKHCEPNTCLDTVHHITEEPCVCIEEGTFESKCK